MVGFRMRHISTPEHRTHLTGMNGCFKVSTRYTALQLTQAQTRSSSLFRKNDIGRHLDRY